MAHEAILSFYSQYNSFQEASNAIDQANKAIAEIGAKLSAGLQKDPTNAVNDINNGLKSVVDLCPKIDNKPILAVCSNEVVTWNPSVAEDGTFSFGTETFVPTPNENVPWLDKLTSQDFDKIEQDIAKSEEYLKKESAELEQLSNFVNSVSTSDLADKVDEAQAKILINLLRTSLAETTKVYNLGYRAIRDSGEFFLALTNNAE